jgi:hypothetical protein
MKERGEVKEAIFGPFRKLTFFIDLKVGQKSL